MMLQLEFSAATISYKYMISNLSRIFLLSGWTYAMHPILALDIFDAAMQCLRG